MIKIPFKMIFFQKRFNYTNTSEYRNWRNRLITTEHTKKKEQNIENIKIEIKQKLENRKIDNYTILSNIEKSTR
jgi:4-alpha-glucanotransferase